MSGGWTVVDLGAIDSTQEEARRRLAGGARLVRTAFRAERQTAGRGRFGRAFASPAGGSWQTFVTHDPDGRLRDGRMPSRTAAILADALEALGSEVRLKWPNDLWTRAVDASGGWGKAGGLLLEHRSGHLLIGVGLNAANDPPEGGARLGLPAGEVSEAVASAVERLLNDPEAIDPSRAWRGRHLLDGRTVEIAHGAGGATLRGRVDGLAPDGGVRLIDADGRVRVVHAGTVARVAPPLGPATEARDERPGEDRPTDVRPTDAGADAC